jgi:mono/diheme cytochrome c family protein
MRRVLRVGAWALLGILGCASAALGYVYWALPRVAATNLELHAADSSEALARGKYLAENVAICMDCHSTRDFSRYSGPVDPSTHGVGGEVFGHARGFPGEIVAGNITPDNKTGIGAWSDAQLAQAITGGVAADGRALFPLMNYAGFSQLCRSDRRDLRLSAHGSSG